MPSQAAAEVADRYDQGALRIAIMVMLGWHLCAVLPVVLAAWSRYGPVAAGAPTWIADLLTGSITGWLVLRGGGRGRVLPLLVCPVLLAGVAVGELAVPGGFFSHDAWTFSVSGWFALVALWRRSLAELCCFFAANALLGLILLVVLGDAGRVGIARFIIYCFGSVLQITLFAGGKWAAAVAGHGAAAEEELARIRNAQLAADAVQAGRRSRYEAVRATVAGLLDGIAAGTLDLAEPASRQRIAVAVTRLRRYLVETDEVPDPLSHELRACADAAERRGVAVDLLAPAGTVPPLPVGVRRALTEPLIAVLAATATHARITVVASAAEVTVAVLADAHLAAALLPAQVGVQASFDAEGELLWVQTRWTGRSASL